MLRGQSFYKHLWGWAFPTCVQGQALVKHLLAIFHLLNIWNPLFYIKQFQRVGVIRDLRLQSVVLKCSTMKARDVTLSKLGSLADSMLYRIGSIYDTPRPRKFQVLSRVLRWTCTVLLSTASPSYVASGALHIIDYGPAKIHQILIHDFDPLPYWAQATPFAFIGGFHPEELAIVNQIACTMPKTCGSLPDQKDGQISPRAHSPEILLWTLCKIKCKSYAIEQQTPHWMGLHSRKRGYNLR